MNATAPTRQDMVTASDLVRQFGTWRERATQSPVYILHRGRPRLVLASVAVMDALCAPHEGEAPDASRRLAALLDGSPEPIVLADRALGIIAASRSVRACFGDAARAGAPLEALAPPHLAPLLAAAARRVAQSLQAEALELPLAHDTTRPMSLSIEPYPDGIAVFGRRASDSEALAAAQIDHNALESAMSLSGDLATARIDARGYLDGAHPTLSRLNGLSDHASGAVRFSALFSARSRGALERTMEAVMADATPRRISADLLSCGGKIYPAGVAFAPLSCNGIASGLFALIDATARPFQHA